MVSVASAFGQNTNPRLHFISGACSDELAPTEHSRLQSSTELDDLLEAVLTAPLKNGGGPANFCLLPYVGPSFPFREADECSPGIDLNHFDFDCAPSPVHAKVKKTSIPNRTPSRTQGRSSPRPPMADPPAPSRRKVVHAPDRIEVLVSQSRQRDRAVTRCLHQVQADIGRVKEKMLVARQRRRGQISCEESPPQECSTSPLTASHSSSRCSGTRTAWSSRPGSRQPAEQGQPHHRSRCAEDMWRRTYCRSHASSGRPASRDAQCAGGSQSTRGGPVFGGQDPRPPPSSRSGAWDIPVVARPPELPNDVAEGIRMQLLEARDGDEAEMKAAVKRLQVRWHPDRNPESAEAATAAFQYIQQEKERLLSFSDRPL